MKKIKNHPLSINAQITSSGIKIMVDKKSYQIIYPKKIWAKTPPSTKQILTQNLSYGWTHFLPLILDRDKIVYHHPLPLFESFLFKNQLYDLVYVEQLENKKPLSYLKKFYNQNVEFDDLNSATIKTEEIPKFKKTKDVAIIPFTFGKESLTTFALCLELGIEPVLVYCQEPGHPFEEKFKRKKLKELEKTFKIKTYFIKNEPGLFRYGLAFNYHLGTEIGWGAQTTLLALMSVPFAFAHQAKYILFGTEHSNNDVEWINDWKFFPSFDQTAESSAQQNNIIKLLTNNQCEVKCMLESLEETNILYTLAHRYPKIAPYLFSCESKKPLHGKSQWCHQCAKCERIYLLATGTGLDPKIFGFKKNLLANPQTIDYYFKESSLDTDFDFCFHALNQKRIADNLVNKFKKTKFKKIKNWNYCYRRMTSLLPARNLPTKYQNKIKKIFAAELKSLKKNFFRHE
ncbi:MAG: hypothetical protein WCX71_05315 [Candidatus Buchananbacteria bacterium]